MKRFLSFFVAFVMVLSMVPAVSFAAELRTVYWDPENGLDTNDGLTEEAPVKSVAAAYAALSGADEGVLVMLGNLTLTAVTTFPTCNIPVTITSKTGAEGILSNSHIIVGGDTTFENMTLTLTKESTGTTICGNGYKMTMGEGLTTIPFVNDSGSYYFCLEGGSQNGAVENTDLTVMSGQYRYIYAGGYLKEVTGNAKLTMTGGTTANLAVSRTGSVSGNAEMFFSGSATVSGALYAGAATSGKIGGSSTVTLGQGAYIKHFYAGSNGSGSITGVVTVILDGFDGTPSTLKGKGGSSATGTTGGSKLLVKSGTLNKAATDFGSVEVNIPEGKVLTVACNFATDTLSGSGTLNFSGASKLTAAAVTGTVNCTANEVLKNHVYVSAPAGAGIAFPAETGIREYSGAWECRDLSTFKGLVLKTDSANKVILYTGLWRSGDTDEHTEVTPYLTETVEGTAYYYYPNLQGNYYVRGTRSGYIGVYQNIYMSEEEAATRTEETVTLEKKGTDGYVPANVYINTSEVMENPEAWKSDLSLFPEEYTKYMLNPTFREDRDGHLMTTGEELEAELTAMDKPEDNMYRYSVGTSLKGRDIPLVIFTETDLSAATTMEEAAAALENSDKLTVLYRAQMHGNEPAGGEGALAMLYMLQDGYAEKLLDKINLIVVPRLNPDGSYSYLRRLSNSETTDPNRDQIHLYSVEMQQFQHCYLLFDPEVVMDGHERMWNNPLGDMQISASFGSMNSDAFRTIALELDQAAFQSLEKAGLNGYYYAGILNTLESTLGGGYYPLAGSMYILQESRGIHESDEAMERRVVGQMATATGLLNYLHENAQKIRQVVAEERAAIAKRGATYEENDLFVLDTDNRKTTAADEEAWGVKFNTAGQTINWATGKVAYPVRYPTVDDKVVRSRPAPTAYVIPANLANIDTILSIITMHGISYRYLPAGATLPLQRYSGTTTLATLSAEDEVRFAEGCYVFTMNHGKGLLLATLMEPDNIDTQHENATGNIAQIGLLGVSDTYRYIRDLNADGTVDYTVTEAEPVNITVYLDGTNGADTANGLTEATAVKTLAQAYAILDDAMEGASVGSQANLKVIGLYELGTTRVYMPKVSFHVTISGVTVNDGFSYTGGSNQETRIVDLNGDTTFQYMTIHCNTGGNYNHLNANGHKLVLGEGLNCTTKATNRYFTVAGGSYSSTTSASTDLTIRSGKWRTVYAGGYLAHVEGEAKADISGCWIYQNIAPSYRGNIGSVNITVSNVTVSDAVETSAIYAGPVQRKNTSQGQVFGDVTITLGENITAQAVYAASCNEGIINGTVTVIAAGADLSQLPVYARRETTTGTTGAAVLKLGANVTQSVTLNAALPLDLNGCDITGDITVDGTLTVFDSATDDYDVSDGKYGEITGTVTGTLAPKAGYIAAANGFHKFGGQYISGVSLRPGNAGIYYTATFLADEVLLSQLETGVAVSLVDLPGDDFATDGDTLYTVGTTGVMIENILTGDAEDIDRAITDIYAASYVKLADGTVLVSENEIAYSLYDILLILQIQNPEAFESFITTHNIENWF